MNIRSLLLNTDLFFHRFSGEVLSREGYIVVRTPSNPDYYWGNYLLFDAPPTLDDGPRWVELFDREIAASVPVRHRAFTWDSPEGAPAAVGPFLEQGFSLSSQAGLVAHHPVRSPIIAEGVTVRVLEGDDDWHKAWENQQADLPEGTNSAQHAAYLTKRMAAFRHMANRGCGAWFGAFIGDRLVGDLGLFFENSVGRFQEVETHPLFRRRGICHTLVAEASRHARQCWGVDTLVIAAERGEPAERIYLSLGYLPTEDLKTLQQNPLTAERASCGRSVGKGRSGADKA